MAYALFRQAEVLCATGARAPATTALREAWSLAEAIGAQPISDAISELVRRGRLEPDVTTSSTSPVSAPEPLARYGLTEREREVLDLVTVGRSNPQIGHALYISPKTVSVHVSNLLAKLGVHNRGEAAALAHRLGAGAPTDLK